MPLIFSIPVNSLQLINQAAKTSKQKNYQVRSSSDFVCKYQWTVF